jgi:two-component system sensor histidine kinase KdpD
MIGVIGFPLLTLVLTAARNGDSLATALSSYLVLVVAVAAIGGVWPAALAAIAGFLLSNYYFTPPIHSFTIGDARDVLALVMFLVTAGVVSVLVDLSARRSTAAVQARTDARMLARVAGRMVSPEGNPLPALLGELMVAFRLDGASVLRAETGHQADTPAPEGADASTGPTWELVASAGQQPPLRPDEASVLLPLTERENLALKGPSLTAEDREILSAFAAQLATALESDRLHAEAAEADSLARANQLRTALLDAVSHDLRTPLASIKAASSSLLSEQLTFGPEETRILIQTIDVEANRLNAMVENLLDMSRLRAGSLEVLDQSCEVGEIVETAVDSLGPRGELVQVAIPEALPHIRTDPMLLERAVVGLIDNALVHAGGSVVRVEAGSVVGRVDIRIIDRGPGIPREDRERVFRPFQRVGDSENRVGVGLGLAVARGFVQAVGGDLDIEDTPGGGCTMVIRIPEVETLSVGQASTDAPEPARPAAEAADPVSPVGPTPP